MPADIALAWDAAARRFDVAVVNGDLALDATPLTPMALALLQDRRARLDDTLPDTPTDAAAPQSLRLRRGTPLDALTTDRAGSRLWLLARAKTSEATRLLAMEAAREALANTAAGFGLPASVDALYRGSDTLGLVARLGGAAVSIQRSTG
jgi:phage gp46-like protein